MDNPVSDTLKRIQALVRAGLIRVTDHGDEALNEDRVSTRDVVAGIDAAKIVEDYPDAVRGPTVLVVQKDREGRSIHVVWGILRGTDGPVHLITAYYPDSTRWIDDFTRRPK